MATKAPTRSEVEDKLRSLLDNDDERASVAKWARRWIEMRNPDTRDPAVWKALVRLVGADLRATDQADYRYGEEDFRAWLGDFLAAPGPDHLAESTA
jgi:hypothetical protein